MSGITTPTKPANTATRIAGGAASGLTKRSQHQRQQQRSGGVPAQIADDARAVGDPVVRDGGRRDDLDLDSALADVVDGVGDEPAGRVPGRPRIRAREDCDLHAPASHMPEPCRITDRV